MSVNCDYLVIGSGIAGLSFAALMANSGKKVIVVEAHEFAGGFGHTFEMANKYKFNAQLHYVWNCGEGDTVYNVLKKLNLHQTVTFETYDPNGFDHMVMPGYSLKIPSNSVELLNRLIQLFPEAKNNLSDFINELGKVTNGLGYLSSPIQKRELLLNLRSVLKALGYLNSTVQDVFDKFKLPLAAQTLLALQWPDFLLPPEKLSFYAWLLLFTGYQRGAYYPTHHFEHVIDSLVQVIDNNGGKVMFNHEVEEFILTDKRVQGVKAKYLISGETTEMLGETVICNMDPKKAAKMIGWKKFSKSLQKKLSYEYSPSNFMAYLVVKDLDLKKHGFGKWNTFHSCHEDLNVAFNRMYYDHDYSEPSFAITTPSLLTNHRTDCPDGWQIVELLTVADYDYFKSLKEKDEKAYRKRKMEILMSMIKQIELHYIPNFKEYLVFKMTGSPTTNEDYCWCPEGNSYGSNMTPKNMGLGRLNHKTSLENFYFCNASSGYAGFAGTFFTGASLYERLSGDSVKQ